MSETIQQVEDLLRNRLSELNDERARVEKALLSLGSPSKNSGGRSKSGPKPGPKPGRKATGRKRKKQVPVEQREEQIIAFIKANPDCKSKDIAAALEVVPNYLSGVLLSKMKKDGRLGKENGKFVLKEKKAGKKAGESKDTRPAASAS